MMTRARHPDHPNNETKRGEATRHPLTISRSSFKVRTACSANEEERYLRSRFLLVHGALFSLTLDHYMFVLIIEMLSRLYVRFEVQLAIIVPRK